LVRERQERERQEKEMRRKMKKEKKEKKAREARMKKTGQVRVPEDCKTLEEAVEVVRAIDHVTTIVVGEGEHKIDGNYLKISSAMNIVGDPGVAKEEIVVVGGIDFNPGIPGNCHLEHLTLRQAKYHGVFGCSSFTMDDVLVEQCEYHGVEASGTGVVGRCTNVEVRQCGYSGVIASNGASITFIGAKTTVHHNCTKGYSGQYGLTVSGTSATIQLVSPLTKEQVSCDNHGGRNWGAASGGDINQIKTTGAPPPSGETKTTEEGVVRVPEAAAPTTPSLVKLMAAWRIKSDVVVALQELGVEAPSDILDLTNNDIEKFIVDTKLKRVEANRFRNGVNAMVVAAASSTTSVGSDSIKVLSAEKEEMCPTSRQELTAS
jgi:uncharacterized protein YjiS (DUF1127 family)